MYEIGIGKMIAGEIYNQADLCIVLKMAKAHLLVTKLNKISTLRQRKRTRISRKLLGFLDGEPYFVAWFIMALMHCVMLAICILFFTITIRM